MFVFGLLSGHPGLTTNPPAVSIHRQIVPFHSQFFYTPLRCIFPSQFWPVFSHPDSVPTSFLYSRELCKCLIACPAQRSFPFLIVSTMLFPLNASRNFSLFFRLLHSPAPMSPFVGPKIHVVIFPFP